MFKKMKEFAKSRINKVRKMCADTQTDITAKAHAVLDNTVGEAYVDTGVKILIAVVLGALLLAGLYALFNTTILPNVTDKVEEIFNYAG